MDPHYSRALEGLGVMVSDEKDFFRNPKEYVLVLFTGGADVSPHLYGETSPKGLCYTNPSRDMFEMPIFEHALKNNIKMTGICRGSQFANVMSGGRMMHDITNHAGGLHEVEMLNGDVITTNSTHHQMIIPPIDGYVLGWSKTALSRHYIGDKDEAVEWNRPETEIVFVPRTKFCGVQWHPESMSKDSDGYIYYHRLINDLISMDINEFSDRYLLSKELEKT